MSVTVEEYQQAERELTMKDARKGLVVHTVVTLLVWAVVIPVNVFVAAEFPWSIFVVAGTGIGLFFHWFGYRHTEAELRDHQGQVVQRASQIT
ncbi:MAG TPA: 2TM domain-containing protein [Actinomycetes bacterium]|jgi:hypothetical protein